LPSFPNPFSQKKEKGNRILSFSPVLGDKLREAAKLGCSCSPPWGELQENATEELKPFVGLRDLMINTTGK